MALNNIIREPRREITETGVGIGLVIVGFAALYWPSAVTAQWFCRAIENSAPLIWWTTALITMVAIGLVGWGALALVHNFGERFCDNLAQRGTEIRGPRRARRW